MKVTGKWNLSKDKKIDLKLSQMKDYRGLFPKETYTASCKNINCRRNLEFKGEEIKTSDGAFYVDCPRCGEHILLGVDAYETNKNLKNYKIRSFLYPKYDEDEYCDDY